MSVTSAIMNTPDSSPSKLSPGRVEPAAPPVSGRTWDAVVIGAGVFGSWTAFCLLERGLSVLLVDAYGASNSRASSGGESRIIRMGYGPDEIYTRWSMLSLERWIGFFNAIEQPSLFHRTGVLMMAQENSEQLTKTIATLERCGVNFERLARAELAHRYPQFTFDDIETAIFEPDSGALLARRAVQALVAESVRRGLAYTVDSVPPQSGSGRLESIVTGSGVNIQARHFVFACGPWLPKVLPDILANRIFPTRQEVLFFGPPAGSRLWSPPAMPTWLDIGSYYGMPDIENRGVKIACDHHGPRFDPDTGHRVPPQDSIDSVRAFMARRFPGLKQAPLVESRVCQYENTSNGDFLIDVHPDRPNVWIAGGGSGHGFKHGPAVGQYVAELVMSGGPTDPRFSFASKSTVQQRSVY